MKIFELKYLKYAALLDELNRSENAKRVFDIVLSLMLLPLALVVSVFFGLLFFLLTLENPIFIQERVGRNKSKISLFKLRTLPGSVGNKPTHELKEKDIPRIGKLMRKAKVDELPQLINVIVGNMSLVGPRPCLPTQIELVAERERCGVFKLRPGITGSAQILGLDMSKVKELVLADVEYMDIHTLGLDLKILFSTAIGKGAGDHFRH